ncbi:MAG: hypothetical protein KUG80_03050 [Gammaproteobacteria bacterium]|nr:hypothetical protein [Gammaproteobacteria bacterium]
MKKLIFCISFVMVAFAEVASADTIESSQCYQSIQDSKAALYEKKTNKVLDVAVDSALVATTSLAVVPTLGASLPIGVALIVGRDMGAAVVKEARVAGHSRLLNLLTESSEYVKDHSSKDLNEYPALKALWYRVNGPIFKRIKPKQVAESVLSVQYDIEFCEDSHNFRMVHFKDYVINNING